MASLPEEEPDGLERELIDDVEGTGAVGRPGVVAKVEEVALRHCLPHLSQDGQSAIT